MERGVAPERLWEGGLRLGGYGKGGCAWYEVGRIVPPGHMGCVIKRDFAK